MSNEIKNKPDYQLKNATIQDDVITLNFRGKNGSYYRTSSRLKFNAPKKGSTFAIVGETTLEAKGFNTTWKGVTDTDKRKGLLTSAHRFQESFDAESFCSALTKSGKYLFLETEIIEDKQYINKTDQSFKLQTLFSESSSSTKAMGIDVGNTGFVNLVRVQASHQVNGAKELFDLDIVSLNRDRALKMEAETMSILPYLAAYAVLWDMSPVTPAGYLLGNFDSVFVKKNQPDSEQKRVGNINLGVR